MCGNKWKILTAFLVVIIIIQALFISHYKEEADKNYERLERLLLWSMGEHFGQLVHPVVFESYSYPYPITPERAKELKLQNLTEENVDAFLFELYYRSGGGRPINRYDFLLGSRWADWEMGEKLYPLGCLLRRYEKKLEAISRMTNKTEKKKALEELLQNTREDFEEIGYYLSSGGNLSKALEIATNGSARRYLDQPT